MVSILVLEFYTRMIKKFRVKFPLFFF